MDLSHLHTFRAVASDLNGQMRGKRLPASAADKLEGGSVRLPYSVLNVDIWGADIEDSPLVFDSGDADGMALPTERGPVPMPWLENPSALVPMKITRPSTSFGSNSEPITSQTGMKRSGWWPVS